MGGLASLAFKNNFHLTQRIVSDEIVELDDSLIPVSAPVLVLHLLSRVRWKEGPDHFHPGPVGN